jgi:hypothetical protein
VRAELPSLLTLRAAVEAAVEGGRALVACLTRSTLVELGLIEVDGLARIFAVEVDLFLAGEVAQDLRPPVAPYAPLPELRIAEGLC